MDSNLKVLLQIKRLKTMFYLQVCTECEEEFCCGSCKDFQYDSYQVLFQSKFSLPNMYDYF